MSYIGNTVTTQGFTPAIDYFNGDGSTTAFTLSRPVASVAQVQVVVNNVPQLPGTAFTVSGNTITFTGAPSSGTSNIYVYYTSPITQVIAPSQGTVSPTSLSTGAPSWDTSGNVTLTGNITLNNGAADGAQLTLASSGYSNWNIDNYSGNLRAYYNATEYWRTDSNGNFLVGTSSAPSGATGSVVANNASYIGSKVVTWAKVAQSNVITATVTFQTTSSWWTNYIKFTVSCVQSNSANNFAASYLYQIATLDGGGGSPRNVLAQGDNAQFSVSVSGNSGTGSQIWTVSVTGPATANRSILTLEAGSSIAVQAIS